MPVGEVLLVGGFEHFTIDRVARHAHIGKATIYSRFPGKGELMLALLARRIEMRSDFSNRRALTWRSRMRFVSALLKPSRPVFPQRRFDGTVDRLAGAGNRRRPAHAGPDLPRCDRFDRCFAARYKTKQAVTLYVHDSLN